MTDPNIRPAETTDLPTLLMLNEAAVPAVNSVGLCFFQHRFETERYLRVATLNSDLAGFLLVMREDAEYESLNFNWFKSRFDRFAYVDRIVVADWAKGRGVGKALYRDAIGEISAEAPRITCEVNTRPRNERSLTFHDAMGFRPVGSQDTENGAKTVQLMSLELA